MARSQSRVLSFGEARNLVDNRRGAARVRSAASSAARGTRFADEAVCVGEVAAPRAPHFLDKVETSRSASRSRTSRTKSCTKSRTETRTKSPAKSSAKASAKSSAKARAKTGRTVSFEEISKKKAAKEGLAGKQKSGKKGSASKTTKETLAQKSAQKGAAGKSAKKDVAAKPAKEDLAGTQKTSPISRFKRKLAKDKAGRAFLQQYGGASASDAPQNAPRAALYKGEIGKTQKRVARMGDAAAQSGSARSAFAYKPKRGSHRVAICLGLCVCIVLSCAFLYPTAQQYYLSLREHDRLQAVYEALEERNAVLQAEVDALSTDAGIEEFARTEFGWVMEGENAVKVYGIESDSEEDSSYVSAVNADDIEAPETWYSPLLDLVFGLS